MPWNIVSNLPRGAHRCGAVAARGYLYVFGGFDDVLNTWNPTILAAKIGTDGTTGRWFTAGRLAARTITGYPALLVHGNYVIMAGHWDGVLAGQTYNDVATWKIEPGGALTQVFAGGLPAPLGACQIFEHRGFVYVLGGIDNGSAVTASLYRARIGSDGSLSPWEVLPGFPGGRALGIAAVRGNSLYLIGGTLVGGTVAPAKVGKIDPDGSTSNWQDLAIPATQIQRKLGAYCRVGDSVYLSGGTDAGGTAIETMAVVHLGPDGGAVNRGSDLAAVGPVVNHAMVSDGHQLIIVGGLSWSDFTDQKNTRISVPASDR